MEIIGRLSQTVQIRRLRQARSKTKVLRLENKACCRRIEEGLIRIPSSDGEGEWIVCVRKDECRVCRVKAIVAFRSRPDRLLDLEDLLRGIVDLDVQSVFYEGCQRDHDVLITNIPVWYSTSSLRSVKSLP